MSAFSIKQALGLEKPHSSITDWVDILSGPNIAEEAYDGIPELVDAINIQPASGPGEASRAIRKKLKHGNAHQQYRALVLLKALVENCGDKFKSSFADGHLTDAIRNMAVNGDGSVDKRVQKTTMLVLLSWHEQFKGDPSMHMVANLYVQCRRERPHASELVNGLGAQDYAAEAKRRAEKEEAKKKAKREKEEAKEKARREEEERRKQKNRPRRVPFDIEKEKPKVLASIVEGSQASSNLINAMTLVNRQTDSFQSNERVQSCLAQAKTVRKQVVRYIQLVEKEELIGTLIETNDRIIAALEAYDQQCAADASGNQDDTDAAAASMAKVHLTGETEVSRLQERQRAAVERARQNSVRNRQPTADDTNLHPDLQDLNFGSIERSSGNLPAPIRPSNQPDSDSDDAARGGSLSDFSDYQSSDEETHRAGPSSGRRNYVTVSDDSDDAALSINRNQNAKAPNDDPFADPFADEVAVGPSKKW